MAELHLVETLHPDKELAQEYEALVGIDGLKEALVDELILILDRERLDVWQKRHHPRGLHILDRARSKAALILLAGDVGCGKTALASCVATPVARAIEKRIACLATPSDIRGGGHVGELSARITEAFTQAKAKARVVGRGILIIDEADDLATARSQMQAHHEDRAGVNVLIKEIGDLARNPTPMAVILITNRDSALDPAVMRRAGLWLRFDRPNAEARAAVFERLLEGTDCSEAEIRELVTLTKKSPPYTFSDLTERIGRLALRRAWKNDRAFGFEIFKEAVKEVEPSPLMEVGAR